jgi:hypothetical protein
VGCRSSRIAPRPTHCPGSPGASFKWSASWRGVTVGSGRRRSGAAARLHRRRR